MSFKEDFFTILDSFSSSPFLFIGSGFSLRYLSTENWESLLIRYANEIQVPFEKYRSSANGNWPAVGSLIAKDYHSLWFDNPRFEDLRNASLQEMVNISSPLKVSISNYLKEKSSDDISAGLMVEIELLKKAKIDGIITTNYDLLCERLFPKHKVYKSQQELIFSTLQEVGEIYKIHGCCSDPNTLVITKEDYDDFESKNAYLAAKLLTIFLEHPTIFIGYSIGDPNIRTILSSVIRCLNQSQVNEISKRLFFIQYSPNNTEEPVIDRYELEIGGFILPLTRITASSYEAIYEVLTKLHQKYPAALLRKIKEHIYELVQTNDPAEKISVVDFDDETDLDNVDVVIGIGVSGNKDKSYETFTRFDIAEDILFDDKGFNIPELCAKTLPKIVKAKSWIPVCKYIQGQDVKNIDSRVLSAANRPLDEWKNGNSYGYKEKSLNDAHNSITDVLSHNDVERALFIIPLLTIDKISAPELRNFLKDNYKDKINKPGLTSQFMKLVCLLDRLEYEHLKPVD